MGRLRVFCEVSEADTRLLRILAVGRKQRNILMIGGKEIRL